MYWLGFCFKYVVFCNLKDKLWICFEIWMNNVMDVCCDEFYYLNR